MTKSQPYTFTVGNLASGVNAVAAARVMDSGFSADDFILVGEMGTETAEIVQIDSFGTSTFNLNGTTSFAHPDTTRVTRVPYDKVQFYWTATDTFDTDNPVGAAVTVHTDSWYTQVDDTSHSTGYGWAVFLNSDSGDIAASTSPIPYSNFSRRTVKRVLDSFWMTLGSTDRKHVTLDMAMEWLNEAYDKVSNAYGMVNEDHASSDGTDTIAVVSGTSKYLLPEDFDEMLYMTVDGTRLDPTPSRDTYDSGDWIDTRYTIRGQYIEFSPAPTSDYTVTYRYQKLQAELTSYHQVIDLPKRGFNILKDYMLFRASTATKRPDLAAHYALFDNEVKEIVAQAINLDNSMDSFGISDQAWS